MRLLKNFDSANSYFDMELNNFITINSIVPIIGWYKLINGLLSALFVQDSKIFMLWNNQSYQINDSSVVKLEVVESLIRWFRLYDSSNLIFEFRYEAETNFSSFSPFEYIDDEDFDWGIFVLNIINNKAKKDSFISNLSNKTTI